MLSSSSSVGSVFVNQVASAGADAVASGLAGSNGSPSPARPPPQGDSLQEGASAVAGELGASGNGSSSGGGGGGSAADTSLQDVDGKDEKRNNKFVYKLYKMVCDSDCQHLISWAPAGTSVVVYNVDEFSAQVLGKHYKHNNFSSFIRQLNMYGFYKVNKTPRGTKNMVESQVWEFSHPQFMRGRPDLLEGIRRRALDQDTVRMDAAKDLQQDVNSSSLRLQRNMDEMVEQLN
ncbi:winged helix DNA-binding domain-containing protein, partial [Tilletiaria anomala UBC 951]